MSKAESTKQWDYKKWRYQLHLRATTREKLVQQANLHLLWQADQAGIESEVWKDD